MSKQSPAKTLVDTNVLLDIFTEDQMWLDWSSEALAHAADRSALVINPIIYAELSPHFSQIEDLDQSLPEMVFTREQIPWEAAFLAGKCFLEYRRRGGSRRSPLPDFFIGAHAAIAGMTLLTRDVTRHRTYFPKLDLVSP